MFNKNSATLAIVACVVLGPLSRPAMACSRVLLNSGPEHVVARTMDLYMSDHGKLVVLPRGIARDGAVATGTSMKWVSKYGSVGVVSFDAALSDGMNEKGLVANLLYLHGTQYETRDTRPGVSNLMFIQYLLDTSATVVEALAELRKVQIVSGSVAGREWPLHLSMSDATGDSAVIEFIKGVMVVHHGADSLVMTNEPTLAWQLENVKRYKYFGGKEALPGDIDPTSRFVRMAAFLKTMPAAKDTQDALAKAYSIAKVVSVPHGALDTSAGAGSEDNWPTLWTTLADSGNTKYFFQMADSPNLFWVDLNKLNFAKGAPVLALPEDGGLLSGEVSGMLKAVKGK